MGDEFTRIARLRELLGVAGNAGAGVQLGIGDDAAVLAHGNGALVLSVDASVENVHFRRSFARLDVIAERAFIAALSDLAAMGATPRSALSALGLPAELAEADFDALCTGTARAAQRYACPVVGGNLSKASEISITTTVVGGLEGPPVTRSGANVGDGIFVTGIVGAAALGLVALELESDDPRAELFVARWRTPVARIDEGLALRGVASAAIDLSDGLLQDLEHLCEASGVGATVQANQLPAARGFAELANTLGHDPLSLMLNGGEDYELLYTVPPLAAAPAFGTCIGVITAHKNKIDVVDVSGRKVEIASKGFKHF